LLTVRGKRKAIVPPPVGTGGSGAGRLSQWKLSTIAAMLNTIVEIETATKKGTGTDFRVMSLITMARHRPRYQMMHHHRPRLCPRCRWPGMSVMAKPFPVETMAARIRLLIEK
jgi:hypothetical protein